MWDECKLAVYIVLAVVCALGWVVGSIIAFLLLLVGFWVFVLTGGLFIFYCLPFFKYLACCVLSVGLTAAFFKLSVGLAEKCNRLINESIAKSKPSIFSPLRYDSSR